MNLQKALTLADEVLLLPIYPARELPIEGVTSKLIVERMEKQKSSVAAIKMNYCNTIKKDYLKLIENDLQECINYCGAGDIDQLVQPIKEILLNNI